MKIDLECHNCKKTFQLDMSKARRGSSIKCPRCRVEYTFKDDGFKKVDDQLKKMLKNIEIKIKL